MNSIIIEDVTVNDRRIDCIYTVYGDWRRYFKETGTFFVEYEREMDGVPQSIAAIPFLCNVLPLVWLFDAEVIIDDIDKDFFDCLEPVKQGYINMYPGVSFKGRVTPKKVTDNRQEDLDKTAVFFSGGVDAYHTLISHIEEKPILVTLWGADITFEDQAGWNLVDQHIRRIAEQNKLDYAPMKTSFRRFLEEGALSDHVFKLTEDNWWYGYQHGIGIIGHIAPFAYRYKIKTVYIASSLTKEDNTTCASDPTIDNFVKFFGCEIIHDGYEFSRPEKTKRISEYAERTHTQIQLRVCWESEGGSNCCHCEKCYRTILCLIAGKSDPRDYGFHYTDDEFVGMMKDFKRKLHFLDKTYFVVYQNIQNMMRNYYRIDELDLSLRWFYRANLQWEQSFIKRLPYRIIRKGEKIYRKIQGSFMRSAY